MAKDKIHQISCVAIDDEPLALELIRRYVAENESLHLLRTFTDALHARDFLATQPVDLLFVDINMPDINGLDLVRSLPVKPMVVFTTAYRKFAVDSYDLDALDYLVKPIEPARFEKTVAKAMEYLGLRQAASSESSDSIFVRSEYKQVRIPLGDILYLESVEDYVRIHLQSARPVLTLSTLKALQERLPAERFLRIHRSYLVPVARIRAVSGRKVKLDAMELPVGDSYVSAVNAWMKK